MHDGTWARGVHWFLTRPGVDGGKGGLDRARGVVAVLRAMPAALHATDEAFLFTTPTGRPVDDSSRSTGTARSARLASVRGRFYATRDLEWPTRDSVSGRKRNRACGVRWIVLRPCPVGKAGPAQLGTPGALGHSAYARRGRAVACPASDK